jgi:hypothetical protein
MHNQPARKRPKFNMDTIPRPPTTGPGEWRAISRLPTHRNVPFGFLNTDELGIIGGFTLTDSLSLASKGLWHTFGGRNRHKHRRYVVTDDNIERLLIAISEPMASLEGTSFAIPRFTRKIQRYISELYASYIHALAIVGGDHLNGRSDQGTIEGALVGLEKAQHLDTLTLNFNGFTPSLRIGRRTLRAIQHLTGLRCLYLGLGGTGIQDDDVVALASAVKKAPCLQVLSITCTLV